jgi:hypothetical protein
MKKGVNMTVYIMSVRPQTLKGRLHGAFSMCVSMSDKPFDAEACDIGWQALAINGLSDMKMHIKNAPCNGPLRAR